MLGRTVYIKASDDELEYIQNLFGTTVTNSLPFRKVYSIPMPNEKVVYWYGDIAKTILLNIQ